MKNLLCAFALIIGTTLSGLAETSKVILNYTKTDNNNDNSDVDRAPMRLPIYVDYDSETHEIEITAPESIEAQVFLYNASGIMEDYSATLNTTFTISMAGSYIIYIQAENWYATGYFEY